jgi:putative photosynthetic complex assembly protein 2
MLSALDLGLTALLACLVWWGSTGLILSLVRRHEGTYRWSMLGVCLMAIGALGLVMQTRGQASVDAAIAHFAAAIAIWGAIEMAFLMGYVTGPRRDPCPRGAAGWHRFRLSWSALMHHELTLFVTLLVLGLLLKGEANTLAFKTFLLLWLMRLSTKFNIFLGVRNASEDLLPPRISYLRTYFRHAPMNALFPLSITAVTVTTLLLFLDATRADALSHGAVGSMLLATFGALALLEHWLLMMPLPSTVFWPWAARGRTTQSSPDAQLVPAITGDR